MTVGVDTYVTVDEADTYISTHYVSSSAEQQRWSGLSVNDKTAYLLNALAHIERLPIKGRKAVYWQPLAFPRLLDIYDIAVPVNVKAAQIELALWLSDTAKQAEQAKRQDLQRQGVVSFGIGDLSENYGGVRISNNAALRCEKVQLLLLNEMSGGYHTC